MTTMDTIRDLYEEIDAAHGDHIELVKLVYKWHLRFFDKPDELELQIALLTGMFPYRKKLQSVYHSLYHGVADLLDRKGRDPDKVLKGLEP